MNVVQSEYGPDGQQRGRHHCYHPGDAENFTLRVVRHLAHVSYRLLPPQALLLSKSFDYNDWKLMLTYAPMPTNQMMV